MGDGLRAVKEPSNQYELRYSFDSLDAWLAYLRENRHLMDSDYIQSLVEHAIEHGISSDALGAMPPNKISILGRNFREQFLAAGFSSRQRTMMELALEEIGGLDKNSVRIYAHEALTNFALFFRGRYPRFIGSEYGANRDEIAALAPILSVDIQASHFDDETFDLILSGDVLEHIPDLHAALVDSCRILKPGGRLLATFPMNYGADETVIKAIKTAQGIVHLMEPEFHGNPANPSAGSLVFQIPGWSILDLARRSGFSSTECIFWSSRSRGFVATELAGNLVLSARR